MDWEERMAQRAQHRRQTAARDAWYGPSRADLDIPYGELGPPVPPDVCRQCWGDRYVWLGNVWGLRHREPDWRACTHSCHRGEVWLA